MEQEKRYFLYVHKNKSNGKCYVGITCQKSPKRRWHNGCNYKHSLYFYNSIEKYGWDNFEHIILLDDLSVEDANLLEKLYISILRSCDRQYGYNIAAGGDCTTQVFTAKPVCQYDYDGNLINRYVSATEAEMKIGLSNSVITACCKGRYKTGGGYLWSYNGDIPNTDFKTSKSAVCQYDLDCRFIKRFTSMSDAAKENAVNISNISACCNHKQKSAGGYIWSFEKDEPKTYKTQRIPVSQYSANGEYITSYSYIKEACEKTIISESNIISCCDGRSNFAGGFIWCFSDRKPNLEVVKKSKPINQYDLDGNYLATYNSTQEVVKLYNFSGSHISNCCNGKRKSSNGFIWRFV